MAAELAALRPIVDDLSGVITNLIPNIRDLTDSFGPAARALGSFASSISTVVTGPVSVLSSAIGGVASAIASFVTNVTSFVGALNPGLIDNLNFAMGDLAATIGEAFAPAIQALVPIIGQIADVLGPVMRDLGPPIAELVSTLASLLIPLLRLFALLVRTVIIPVIRFLTNALQWLIKAVVETAAYMLKFFGANGALDKLISLFSPDKGGRSAQAIRNVGIGGIEDVLKANVLASLRAGQGRGPESEVDWLKQIHQDLLDIKKNAPSIGGAVEKTVDFFNPNSGGLFGGPPQAPESAGAKIARNLGNIIASPFQLGRRIGESLFGR